MWKQEFKEELRKLCLKYDAEYGHYPESPYEGRALFEFFLEQFTNTELSKEQYKEEINLYNIERKGI